jgi:hypothetical protein
MVFFLQTSDLIKEGYLCCFAGCETKTEQIIDRNLCRRLRKQKTKIVVISICMGTFLTGKLSFSHERYRSICRIDCLAYAYATPCNQKPILAFLFLGCFAMGWMEVVGLAITGIAIDSQVEIGTAVGVVGSTRSPVSTIASIICTAILTTRLKKAIPQEVPSNLIAAGLPSSVASFCQPLQLGHLKLLVKSRS